VKAVRERNIPARDLQLGMTVKDIPGSPYRAFDPRHGAWPTVTTVYTLGGIVHFRTSNQNPRDEGTYQVPSDKPVTILMEE
jgi:hypothetical protein